MSSRLAEDLDVDKMRTITQETEGLNGEGDKTMAGKLSGIRTQIGHI
jgi:hypothetical protein